MLTLILNKFKVWNDMIFDLLRHSSKGAFTKLSSCSCTMHLLHHTLRPALMIDELNEPQDVCVSVHT